MLTETQCPYTGPYGIAESGLKSKGPTAEALKRAMSRLGYLAWSDNYDQHFNQPLVQALSNWDPGAAGYGKGRWEKIRAAKIPASLPHSGEYALDATAQDLIRDEYKAAHPPPKPMPSMVYPHDKDFHSYSGGYVHQTGGIRGNYALDFLAGPETPVLAPEAGVITRLSGHDPATGLHGSNRDVFGWSIYMRVPLRGFYYSTHYGRVIVHEGQQVRAGQVVGYVGRWPYDTPRSHTHLGYTSFSYVPWVSRNRIRAVAASPRVDGVMVGQ
jgi:murein DD-endopeptidase MepM/ murein hydrolase activator NlpD